MRLLPMGLLALGVGLYVISLWQENEMARPMPEQGTAGLVALVGKTYWHYLSKLFWPSGLSPVYRIDRVGAFDGAAIAGFGLVLAIALAAWRRRDPLLTLGTAWFAVALLPVSNIIPVYFFVQDRYAFVATVGAAIVVARGYELFRELPSSLWSSRIAVAAVALALSAVAGFQGTHWHTSLSLWQRATTVQPDSYYAFLALGHTERDRGELDAAVAAYSRAVENEPDLPHARISLCMADAMRVARRRGHSEAAVDQVGRALTRQWRSAEGLADLSARLQRDGYAACAQLAESRAFDLDPPEPRELVIAASRWTISGQGELALRYLSRAADGGLDEDDPTALEVRAQALELTGHPDEARQTLRRSLSAEPRSEHRLVAAAAQLIQRGRPDLALLYADVAGRDGQLTERWAEIREQAESRQR
jgi:tetratricopeptide (TPR) repeat protein